MIINLSLSLLPQSCHAEKVKLESTTEKFIQIFELQAYSSGVNVALQGSATQSSLYNDDVKFEASKAIDGINSTFSHTKNTNAWLEVALTSPHDIESVIILNRWCANSSDVNGCLCRLSDSILTLYNKNGVTLSARKIGNTCGLLVLSEKFMSCTQVST